MHAFFQPAALSTPSVRRHYEDTITRPVVFADHVDVLEPKQLALLHERFPEGSARMWGVTPGRSNANVSKALKITPGDHAFFSGDKHAYLSALVMATFHNPALAERLWGVDENGLTWEYMYAIDGVRGHQVPMDEIRELLGWNPARNVQNLTHLSEVETNLLHELLDLDDVPPLVPLPVDTALEYVVHGEENEKEVGTAPYDGELEGKVTRLQRKEQRRLKRLLLQRSNACALCGRILPPGFLVAAHIKKRARCDDTERRDLKNVGMLACVLGCDSLYEHGYIAVGPGGEILVSPQAAAVTEVARHVTDHFVDRTVTWWNEEREPYFAWHRGHTYRAAPVE
ncbi:hypothetical protein [Embleya sp. MST-111070]|uniref:hypothetical protein n=1 Tax=Embleya sp. MST-111070 TaxID=3398231 RepID=UPI003F731810